jgi:branched-chain amino acid transport system ATP-binding protein
MPDLLQVENVSKSFGGLRVSRDISFALKPGDRVGLIGPNGAGKTTLINLISGILKPTSGHIRLKGADVTKLDMVERSRLGLVRSFQISRLFRELTVFENVILPVLQRAGQTSRTFSTAIEPRIAEEATQILTALGIGAVAERKAGGIAYGEQRLVELAMALAMKPDVLLLDEPAAGAGGNEAARILEAIEQLPREIAILLIDHDMDLVFRFAKRVIVLAEGAVIFEGPSAEVASNESVRKAYLGSFAHARGVA